MKTIETLAIITPDGTLTARVPAELPPGRHRVVLVMIEEEPAQAEKKPSHDLPLHDVGAWPEGLSLRREDLYDDWGR